MKKKSFYLLITLLIIIFNCQLSHLSAQTFSGGGNGTSNSPWKLTNNADINTLATWTLSGVEWSKDKYFELLNDIGNSMNPVTAMIGSNTNPFMGNLQGNGYSIYVNYTGTSSYTALFQYAANCKIYNLTISGNITPNTSNNGYAAGLIALLTLINNAPSGGTFEMIGCENKANITSKNRVGGLISQINSSGNGLGNCIIKNCSNKGNISLLNGSIHYGGIVGTITGNSNLVVITNCNSDSCNITFNQSSIYDTVHIGGIVGCINPSNTTIDSCYNRSNINSSGSIPASEIIIGGVVALSSANSSNNINIKNSQNYATITVNAGDITIGGIIGENFPGSTLNINNCHNYDTIYTTSSGTTTQTKVGGILGNNLGVTTIKHSTNRGVTNTAGTEIKAGGITGDNDTTTSQIFIDTCYNYANHISNSSYYLAHLGGILGDNVGQFTITGCRNTGDILGYGSSMHYDLGGIVGDNMGMGTITRCTNIGTIYTTTTAFSSSITLGGIIGFGNTFITVNNCHNAGLVQGIGNVGGIIGLKYDGGNINNNLNVGCILLNNTYSYNNVGAIAGSSAGGTISNNFYDKQMCVYSGINDVDNLGTIAKTTNELVNGSGISLAKEIWIYTSNIYPMLFNDSISKVAASPTFLYDSPSKFDKHNNVSTDFIVSTLNSIYWTSSNTNIISISGTSATLIDFGNCNIYPNLGTIKRTVPITTVPETYLLVTRPDTIGNGTTTPNSVQILGTIIITAMPSPCYEFVAWIDKNGDTISKNRTEEINFNRDTLLIACFIKASNKTLKLLKKPQKGGEVYGGKTNVPCGTLDTIIATSNLCYKFICWTDSVTGMLISTDSIYITAIDSNRTLIANFFEMAELLVKTKPQPEYAGTTTGDGLIHCLSPNVVINASPNDCYRFVRWIDGTTLITISTKAIDTLTAYINFFNDVTLIAIFELDSININTGIYPSSAAGITSINDGYAHIRVGCEDSIIISATPKNECYKFVNWVNSNTGAVVSDKIKDTLNFKHSAFLIANFILDTFHLTLATYPNNFGDVLGGGKVVCGDGSVIEAKPNKCKSFVNWTDAQTGEIVSNEALLTIYIEEDRHLIANFITDTFRLTLSSSPRNAGILTKEGLYECGTNALITAVPIKDCYTFSYWINANTGKKIYETEATIEMISDLGFVAHFNTTDTFYLEMQSNPSNINIILSGDGLYSTCDSVALCDILIFNKCINFINWTDKYGNVISDDVATTIFVKFDSLLIANFSVDYFPVSLTPMPEEAGTVNSIQYYEDTLLCDELFEFIAKANTGWRFVSWTDSLTGQIISTKEKDYLYVSEETKLIANFTEWYDSVTITLIPNPSGGGTLKGGGKYLIDAEIQLEATTNNGFVFINWTENGILLNKNASFTITASRDMTIYGNFVDANANYYIVSLLSNIDDACVLTGGGPYLDGAIANILAIPNSKYQFKHWQTLEGKILSTNPDYAFKVTSDTDLVAYFYTVEYVVTIYAYPSYMGLIEGGTTGLYQKGHTFNLQAIPIESEYYAFTYWSSNKEDTLSHLPYLKLVVQSDTTVIANFVDKIGVAEYNQDNIYIYPNPTNNIINIVLEDVLENNVGILITNILGDKKVCLNTSDIKSHNNNFKIDVSDFPTGMYFVYFNFTDNVVIKKIIVY